MPCERTWRAGPWPGRWRAEQLLAEILELPGGRWGVGESAPAATGAVQHCPDQAQAGAFAGELAADLGPPAGLAEGPLEQVGRPNTLPARPASTGGRSAHPGLR
jgi:hypothetical protein